MPANGFNRRVHGNRPRGNTTARGYGYTHQQRRAKLLPHAIGTRCPAGVSGRCTVWMLDPKLMHLDHSTPLALGGTQGDRIICKPCNLSLGAALGNRLRYGTPTLRGQSRQW